jgi:hypothetical protein
MIIEEKHKLEEQIRSEGIQTLTKAVQDLVDHQRKVHPKDPVPARVELRSDRCWNSWMQRRTQDWIVSSSYWAPSFPNLRPSSGGTLTRCDTLEKSLGHLWG